MEKYRNVNIFYHHNYIILLKIPNFLGNTFNSVGRVPFSRSQGRGFESHEGHGVVSLSKTLHLHCLKGLVQPDMTEKLSAKKKRKLFFLYVRCQSRVAHYVHVSVLIKFSQKTSVFTLIIISSPLNHMFWVCIRIASPRRF